MASKQEEGKIRWSRDELLGKVGEIDRELPDGWLAVVACGSLQGVAYHTCVPLVYGAREHLMLRIPRFSVVCDSGSIHVLLGTHHVQVLPGHVSMIRGFTPTSEGSFYVTQIDSPDKLDEMRNRILSLAMTCQMQANTPLPPQEE